MTLNMSSYTSRASAVSPITISGQWLPFLMMKMGVWADDEMGPPGRYWLDTVASIQGSSSPLTKRTRSNLPSHPLVYISRCSAVKPCSAPEMKPLVSGNLRAHCRDQCSTVLNTDTMLVPSDLSGPVCHPVLKKNNLVSRWYKRGGVVCDDGEDGVRRTGERVVAEQPVPRPRGGGGGGRGGAGRGGGRGAGGRGARRA